MQVGAIVPRTLPFAQVYKLGDDDFFVDSLTGSLQGGRAITYFRQALALDEHRARFEPQLWMPDSPSASIPCTVPTDLTRQKSPPASAGAGPLPEATNVKEIWFAGAHSNVGGGQTATDGDFAPRLSHLPLRWMIREAFDCGLQLDIAAVVASPLYAPWIPDVEALDLSTDQPVLDSKDPHFHPVPETTPQAFVAKLVHLATYPSPRLADEALAPRGDSLSLAIKLKPQGFFANLKKLPSRIKQRTMTAAWWILESVPRALRPHLTHLPPSQDLADAPHHMGHRRRGSQVDFPVRKSLPSC